jgi:hypothetical protein
MKRKYEYAVRDPDSFYTSCGSLEVFDIWDDLSPDGLGSKITFGLNILFSSLHPNPSL